jgi:hypothetical protein
MRVYKAKYERQISEARAAAVAHRDQLRCAFEQERTALHESTEALKASLLAQLRDADVDVVVASDAADGAVDQVSDDADDDDVVVDDDATTPIDASNVVVEDDKAVDVIVIDDANAVADDHVAAAPTIDDVVVDDVDDAVVDDVVVDDDISPALAYASATRSEVDGVQVADMKVVDLKAALKTLKIAFPKSAKKSALRSLLEAN